MKPIQNTFTDHIKGLYEGHEVAPPNGMQDSIFNKLDSQANSDVSSSASMTSKAVLAAAVVLIGVAWYLMPTNDDAVSEEILTEEVVVEEVVAEEVAVEEVAVEEVVAKEAVTEEVVSTVVVPAETKSIESSNPVVEVKENPVVGEEIKTSSVVATPPVEVIQETEEAKVKEEEEDKKEDVEWVLPAKLKVDE
jgi:hypothetical protein